MPRISKPTARQPACCYEVVPACDLLGDWILMCNGSQWKTTGRGCRLTYELSQIRYR